MTIGGAFLSETIATIVKIILSQMNRRILKKRIIYSYEEVRYLSIALFILKIGLCAYSCIPGFSHQIVLNLKDAKIIPFRKF